MWKIVENMNKDENEVNIKHSFRTIFSSIIVICQVYQSISKYIKV